VFNIPVPEFALRVREMEVEAIRRIGSHRFFMARVISDETYARDEELHAIQGFIRHVVCGEEVQIWRFRSQRMRSISEVCRLSGYCFSGVVDDRCWVMRI
jgi:hypothetical protein